MDKPIKALHGPTLLLGHRGTPKPMGSTDLFSAVGSHNSFVPSCLQLESQG